jgi:hypothetical protein
MEESNKQTETKPCTIHDVVCSSCGISIMPNDDKHCFFDEDIEDGIKPECIDCHLDRESICRDFGF